MITSPNKAQGLSALVPRRLIRSDVTDGVRQFRGVILFADIAGFTRLTENAARREGTRGIELLTGHINTILGSLVDSVLDAGGDVLKFGGDAILAAFDSTGDDHHTLRQALHSSYLMRHAMASHRKSIGRDLSLHLGLAFGDWNECVAGTAGSRREHFVWGDAIKRAMGAADVSTGLACVSCAPGMVPPEFRKSRRQLGPRLFEIRPVPLLDFEDAGADLAEDRLTHLWDFLPPSLRNPSMVDAFDAEQSAEHRRVTTLFGFWKAGGRSQSAGLTPLLLSEIVRLTHDASSAHGGLWVRSDPSGTKQKLLILFGATESSQNDADNALQTAERLQTGFSELHDHSCSPKLGIGIATGTVFTGFVGNLKRREFTVMGDVVNLAARFAARAQTNRTLADTTTREESNCFMLEPSGLLHLKNVRKPTPVFQVSRGLTANERTGTSVDVIEHPLAMRKALEKWESGVRILEISATAGTDVDLFLRQFLRRLDIDETDVCNVECDPDDVSHPGRATRSLLLRARFTRSTEVENNESLRSALGRLESETALSRTIARRGIEAAVRDTLQYLPLSLDVHSLVILRRADYATEFDRVLIRSLLSRGASRVIWISHDDTLPGPVPQTESAVTLGRITKSELATICHDLLAPARASSSLIDFLYERSQGNAKLAIHYLTFVTTKGYASRTSGPRQVWQLRNADAIAIPNGLRAHYLQQVDRLPHEQRTVLRAVAVLEDSATITAVRCLCRDVNESNVLSSVNELVSLGLIRMSGDLATGRLSIVDPTCRQAVYDTMTHARRESWHREAAQILRASGRASSAAIGEHLFRCRDPRCARWLVSAARKARALWSLDRARQYYRWAALAQCAKFDPNFSSVCPPLRRKLNGAETDTLRSLAEVLELQGLHPEAARLHRSLARVSKASHDMTNACRHELQAARMEWFAGRYDAAARQAKRILQASKRLEGVAVTSQALFLLGETSRRTGKTASALRWLSAANQTARKLDDSSLQADILNALGLLHWNCGRLGEAQDCFESALTRLGSRGDASRRGQVANNLGILFEEQGMLRQARRYYERAFQVFDQTGVRRRRAYSLGNLANLDRHAARYERARNKYEEVDTELRAIGESHAAAYTAGNLGDLARDFGDYRTALLHYNETLAFALKSGDEELKSECYSRLAHTHLLMGKLGYVPRLLRKAAHAARIAESREFALCAKLIELEYQIIRGNFKAAATLLSSVELDVGVSGLVLYRLWTQHIKARLCIENSEFINASKLIREGLHQSSRSGYLWWEFRFALAGTIAQLQKGLRRKCLIRSGNLVQQIRQGIGDAQIRENFENLPLFRHCDRIDRSSVQISQSP